MSGAGTKSVQRKISPDDLIWPGYRRAPDAAKPTALGLWVQATDPEGRAVADPELLAGTIYPGRAATEDVLLHLVMLEEAGFLDLYEADGVEVLALRRPLMVDARSRGSDILPPPTPLREAPRNFAAVGGGGAGEWASAEAGARERAQERMREVRAEWASRQEPWEDAQEGRATPPVTPLRLRVSRPGCPEHPNGRFADCGPCGTGRRRHEIELDEQRLQQQWLDYERSHPPEHTPPPADDEPF